MEAMIVTALLSSGVARVTHGMAESVALVDEILSMEHVDSETTLSVGEVEFHRSKQGPFPNHQMRVSARPSIGLAALNYTDHDDAEMLIANSFNSQRPLPRAKHLIFNGEVGSVFPRSAAISIDDARRALIEWLKTRKRPTNVQWRPYDQY